MISRPKNTDTMDDVMQMQNEYIQKQREGKLQPAAQAVKVNNEPKRKSLFARQRNIESSQKKAEAREIISEVVERKYDPMEIDEIISKPIADDTGFPKAMAIDASYLKKESGKSIFSEMMKNNESTEMECSESSDALHEEINKKNVEKLQQMTHEEIMEEREALMRSIDPALLQFIKNRKKPKSEEKVQNKDPPPAIKSPSFKDFPSLDFLESESSTNWLNMNVLEPEKLEWTKNIEETFSNLKPGESFEARFDWKGMLLPYIDRESLTGLKDDRELYLHGEDSHRPGYTLQELFRLARATVFQQRLSALTAIAGILNIYNQGFYDGILDLPITKIFFFLRFALDENTPATIEVSSKALANLFYNDTDETLLDLIYEERQGFKQPLMNNSNEKSSNEFSSELESAMEELSLNEKIFESNIDDGRETEINDFHLAEINLVECLVRTNIINRITYILTTTRPNEVTVKSCVKILIRIARTSKEFAGKIFNSKILCEMLINENFNAVEDQTESSYLILKLFRVIASHDISLIHLKFYEKVKNIIMNRGNINVNLLKSQIEGFRFMRLYFIMTSDDSVMGELLFSLRYLLEWHYQFLEFHAHNHFIIRMHASAIFNLLTCSNLVLYAPVILEIVKMSCSKWFFMATKENVTECSQKILLSSALEVTATFSSFASESFHEFFDGYLKGFLKSKAYKNMENSLISSSPLLNDFRDRSSVHKPLTNLGSIIRRSRKSAPTLILTQDYSTYFIHSLHRLKEELNTDKDRAFYNMLQEVFASEEIEKYLNLFASLPRTPHLATNWFVRGEISFIHKQIINRNDTVYHQKTLKIALMLLSCLTCDNSLIALEIFDRIIFNSLHYSGLVLNEDILRWKYIFNGVIMSKVNAQHNSIAIAENWSHILLQPSWTYSLFMLFLYNAQIDSNVHHTIDTELKEEEIIKTTLQFNGILHDFGLQLISKDQQFMYLMLVYFGKDLDFLNVEVKEMILKLFKSMKNYKFNFDIKLNNEKSFEDLYTMFLETFQANSYGDDLFSAFVMTPLAQKYDAKWRKLIWSQYAMVLKFINCDENSLLYDFNEFLYPIETDGSLLKSYSQALASNLLRTESLPWKIANHHVKNTNK